MPYTWMLSFLGDDIQVAAMGNVLKRSFQKKLREGGRTAGQAMLKHLEDSARENIKVMRRKFDSESNVQLDSLCQMLNARLKRVRDNLADSHDDYVFVSTDLEFIAIWVQIVGLAEGFSPMPRRTK
jgi:hypothetical protein